MGSLFGLFSVQFGLLDVGYYQKSPEPKEDETHVEVAISSARLRFIWKPRRWAKGHLLEHELLKGIDSGDGWVKPQPTFWVRSGQKHSEVMSKPSYIR